MINILRRNLKRILFNYPTYNKSFSQTGEDIIIDLLFKIRKIYRPSYLDIGAYHPWDLSNTALFYLKGSRGVVVEPNPNLIQSLKKDRPGDILVPFGIGPENATLTFYDFKNKTLGTFSEEEFEHNLKMGFELDQKYNVDIITLDQVLSEYCNGIFPDLLSIDVEGNEIDIFKQIRFHENFPKVICAETVTHSRVGKGEKRNDLIGFLISKNYRVFADTYFNTIFIHQSFWDVV